MPNAFAWNYALSAPAILTYKGQTVCTFRYCGVRLVSAYLDGFQCAVMLAVHVVLAACYIAFNTRIL